MTNKTVNVPQLSTTTPKRDKVILVGSASSSSGLVPWDDYSQDIWALSWRQADIIRADALFDLHRIDSTRTKVPPNYLEWLKSRKCPVYVQEALPEVPNSVAYPLKEAIKEFGDYFVSSVAYMIALAILQGYKEISLYGIDLLDDTEYSHQRPNAEYLLGIAVGRGIKVNVPQQSALLKFTHRYGYQDAAYLGGIDDEVLDERIAKYRAMQEEGIRQAYTADGAAQEAAQLKALIKNSKRGKVA